MKEKKVANPWSFAAPDYDKRTGMFVNAGDHHGAGKTQPVGSDKHCCEGPIKYGHIHTMRDDVKG
jgi:hypothetical protein